MYDLTQVQRDVHRLTARILQVTTRVADRVERE